MYTQLSYVKFSTGGHRNKFHRNKSLCKRSTLIPVSWAQLGKNTLPCMCQNSRQQLFQADCPTHQEEGLIFGPERMRISHPSTNPQKAFNRDIKQKIFQISVLHFNQVCCLENTSELDKKGENITSKKITSMRVNTELQSLKQRRSVQQTSGKCPRNAQRVARSREIVLRVCNISTAGFRAGKVLGD